MIGKRFGRLVVVRLVGSQKGRRTWECRCDCDGSCVTTTDHLTSGNTSSCGCLKEDHLRSLAEINRTHGMHGHPVYRVHEAMMRRCYNPNDTDYPSYGGRGIGVCKEWREDRAAFFVWALASGYRSGLTIDRKDNSLGYSPDNCRWLTNAEHQRLGDRRNLHKVTWNGETHTLAEWARVLERNPNTIKNRIARGWSAERAFTQP